MNNNSILKVSDSVSWIGIQDPGLVTFDVVMETKYGSTYNSYFIDADKKTLIDTAKENFKDDYLNKVKSIVDPAAIEFIVINHTEPDHSGCLKHLLKIAPNATVAGSGNAIRYLQDIVGFQFKSIRVKDGDTLDLGNKTLRIISAPNLHWPDTIYSYLEEEQVLFTCDSFGAHFCHEKMFDDEVPDFEEAFKYYFDVILKPFSKFMIKAIDKIRDLDIRVICPGHGAILRSNWQKYVDLSYQYASNELNTRQPEKQKVLIPYVSAYGYTRQMAEYIAKGIDQTDELKAELLDIEDKTFIELHDLVSAYSCFVVGSPTLNQNILPQLYLFFAAINPIRDKGKLFAAFGSYGWSGEAAFIIENALSTLKLRKAQDGLMLKFSPQNSGKELIAFGKSFAEKVMENRKA